MNNFMKVIKKKITFLFTVYCFVKFPSVLLVLVPRIDKRIDKMIKITASKIRYSFDRLCSFSNKLDNAKETIIAFTDGKIIALITSILVEIISFFKATLNNVFIPRLGFYSFLLSSKTSSFQLNF